MLMDARKLTNARCVEKRERAMSLRLILKPTIWRALSFLAIIARKHSGAEFLKAITCETTTKVFSESNSTILSRTRLAQMMHNARNHSTATDME